MTVVGIECNGAAFLTSIQEGPNQKLFFQEFFHNSASKMANCIIVFTVNCLMLLLANSYQPFLVLFPFAKLWS